MGSSTTNPRWGCVAIVGVGLIGGSIGLALRRAALAREVLGIGRDPDRLQLAQRLGAIDRWSLELVDAAHQAEIIVLSTPVQLIAAQAVELLQAPPRRAVVTDCGSIKGVIVEDVYGSLPRSDAKRFVPAHPLAGSERSGVEHARAELFQDRLCVLTPVEATDRAAIQTIESLWRSLGAKVQSMSPVAHDEFLAWTSHAPHAVAAALVRSLPETAKPLVATGFLDTTRIAASSEELWTPILLSNRDALRRAIDAVMGELNVLKELLTAEDAPGIRRWWQQARHRRQQLAESDPTAQSPTDASER